MTDSQTPRVDLYNTTYGHFQNDVRAQFRHDAYGEDIGQNSWITADEYQSFFPWLGLQSGTHVLEIASGSGGPALFLARSTGATVVGVDINEHGITTGNAMAQAQGLATQVRLQQGDANQPLPFADHTFDALICIDSINHLPNRRAVLQEWRRVLRPGGRVLYTDPIVVTGLMSKEEIATRSSIGFFLFGPPSENERLLEQAGFQIVHVTDCTENIAQIAQRSLEARIRYREQLLAVEGEQTYAGLQRFFDVVQTLASERRLSRFAYVASTPE